MRYFLVTMGDKADDWTKEGGDYTVSDVKVVLEDAIALVCEPEIAGFRDVCVLELSGEWGRRMAQWMKWSMKNDKFRRAKVVPIDGKFL